MRKIYFLMGAMLLSASLAGCQNQVAQSTTAVQSITAVQSTAMTQSTTAAQTETAMTEAVVFETGEDVAQSEGEVTTTDGTGTLVVYFSYAENAELPNDVDASSSASIQRWNDEITGNTGVVAHMIAEAAGAEICSIRTVEQYPSNYDDTLDQGQKERNANARPALAEEIANLSDCETLFLGFPTWWGDMPMALYTFLDEYDLSGKKVILFCTSGGSGFSGAVSSVQGLEPEAEVIQGLSIGASSAMQAQEEVNEWVAGLGL